MGRPLAVLHVSDSEREVLERWTRRQKSANALATRARTVWQSADSSAVSARPAESPSTFAYCGNSLQRLRLSAFGGRVWHVPACLWQNHLACGSLSVFSRATF